MPAYVLNTVKFYLPIVEQTRKFYKYKALAICMFVR